MTSNCNLSLLTKITLLQTSFFENLFALYLPPHFFLLQKSWLVYPSFLLSPNTANFFPLTTKLTGNQYNFIWERINLMGTTNTVENIFVKTVSHRIHSGFKEWVCNFSTEEAAIREVWMEKRRVSAGEERCLVVKEQTKWFFPLVLSSDFLPRPRRNEWMCFVFTYVMLTWSSLFFFVSSTGAL